MILDCRKCKNFKDKKKFGGPGIKKKACINKGNKKKEPLYILSRIAGIILDIDLYENNYRLGIPENPLLLLINIIKIDNDLIRYND